MGRKNRNNAINRSQDTSESVIEQPNKYLLPSYLENDVARKACYCKRKRGLLKKVMELSNLCGQQIQLVIFDEKKQILVQYNSHEKFGRQVVNKLLNPAYQDNSLFKE
jgi:hypothetical protein